MFLTLYHGLPWAKQRNYPLYFRRRNGGRNIVTMFIFISLSFSCDAVAGEDALNVFRGTRQSLV